MKGRTGVSLTLMVFLLSVAIVSALLPLENNSALGTVMADSCDTADCESETLGVLLSSSWVYFEFTQATDEFIIPYDNGEAIDLQIGTQDCCILDDVVEILVDNCHIGEHRSIDGIRTAYQLVSLQPGSHTIRLRLTSSLVDASGWYYELTELPFTNLPWPCAPPMEDIAEATISDTIRSADLDGDGNPDFGWDSGYDISFVDQTLHIEINIQLVGDDPGAALRQQWEQGIEDIWSHTFNIADGNYRYPVDLEVNWVSADAHHVVTVHAANGRHNMLNWYTETNWGAEYQDEIAAHEAGHMLGLYDEYSGGALDPNTQFTTTNSIMADLGPPRTWHYDQILEWLENGSGRDLSAAPSPLPPYPFDEPIPHFSDPQVLNVRIDIKPGSRQNPINVRARGVIPVAILTTSTMDGESVNFDATEVDPLSAKFGPGEATEVHAKGHILDVDGDGDLDMILHFDIQGAGIEQGLTEGCLVAKTCDGQDIQGCDSVKTL